MKKPPPTCNDFMDDNNLHFDGVLHGPICDISHKGWGALPEESGMLMFLGNAQLDSFRWEFLRVISPPFSFFFF